MRSTATPPLAGAPPGARRHGRRAGAAALPAAARRGARDRPERRAGAARAACRPRCGSDGRCGHGPARDGWSRSGHRPGPDGVDGARAPGRRGPLAADRTGRPAALAAAPRPARRVGGAGRVGAAGGPADRAGAVRGRDRLRRPAPRPRAGHARWSPGAESAAAIGAGDEVRGARAGRRPRLGGRRAGGRRRAGRPAVPAGPSPGRARPRHRPAGPRSCCERLGLVPRGRPSPPTASRRHLDELGCRPRRPHRRRVAAAVARSWWSHEPSGDRRPVGGAPAKLAGDGGHRTRNPTTSRAPAGAGRGRRPAGPPPRSSPGCARPRPRRSTPSCRRPDARSRPSGPTSTAPAPSSKPRSSSSAPSSTPAASPPKLARRGRCDRRGRFRDRSVDAAGVLGGA